MTGSPAAIFELIGRTKAASAILADLPSQLRTESAMGVVTITPAQRDRLAELCRDLATRSIALCTLLHEIADTQPTTGETHESHVASSPSDRG